MTPNAVANAAKSERLIRHRAAVAALGVRIGPAAVVAIAVIATLAIDRHANFTMPFARPAVNPRRFRLNPSKAAPFIAAIVFVRGPNGFTFYCDHLLSCDGGLLYRAHQVALRDQHDDQRRDHR